MTTITIIIVIMIIMVYVSRAAIHSRTPGEGETGTAAAFG